MTTGVPRLLLFAGLAGGYGFGAPAFALGQAIMAEPFVSSERVAGRPSDRSRHGVHRWFWVGRSRWRWARSERTFSYMAVIEHVALRWSRRSELAERGSASFYAAELSSMEQVRGLAEAILRDYDRLDVLVNNAGISLRDDTRQTSADGHELGFAVNYLSGFLLTHLLLPIIPDGPESSIVNVSSGAQTPIDLDDPMMESGYSGRRSYAQSKLAQILFTFDLARELESTGVRVNTLHPATFMNTNMVLSAGIQPRTSVEEGRDAVLNLITSRDIGSGRYFNGLRPAQANHQAYDEEARARLRHLSEELTGL